MKRPDFEERLIPETLLNEMQSVGIDIGSLYIKATGLSREGRQIWRYQSRHEGCSEAILERLLHESRRNSLVNVGIASGSSGGAPVRSLDPMICLKTAVQAEFPNVRNILEVGGSRLYLVRLDERGRILSLHSNSLCAAGTGSFLDAQASRMGIRDQEEAEMTPDPIPPSIATRCAVFAKSDLVYRQQEGHSVGSLWSGVCKGMVSGLLDTLTRGRPLTGLTVLSGGVALNETFTWWLRRTLEDGPSRMELAIMPQPQHAISLGAALLAGEKPAARRRTDTVRNPAAERVRRPPLRLVRSRYPAMSVYARWTDELRNELTVHPPQPEFGRPIDMWLGLDVGSTSTKLVLMDERSVIRLDAYRRTDGDPIAATQKLFRGVLAACEAQGLAIVVKGAATTGAGRKIIGGLVGADLVVNEITAHTVGALRVDPEAETIFEIGGQDAKYMVVKDGRLADCNMNYVCAAGTGSFVEELTGKLGFALEQLGDAVMGVAPPYTSSRCTVFMEQDVLDLLRTGCTREEAAAAVIYSVIENYLEKVVGRRPIGKSRVVFQGATARNKALVAAIENICGIEVVVSPYCHVMGAYGAALLSRSRSERGSSNFRGLDLGNRRIGISREECSFCSNRCSLIRADIEGQAERPVWGMKCGREESGTTPKRPAEFALFRRVSRMSLPAGEEFGTTRALPAVRVPSALSTFSMLPYWRALFEALDIPLRLGENLDQDSISRGSAATGSEFCLPVKAAVGHIAKLAEEGDRSPVFVPHLLADPPLPRLTHTRYCPYIEALPSILRTALPHLGEDRVIAPILDFRLPARANAREIVRAFEPHVSLDEGKVEKALAAAGKARLAHERRLVEMGDDVLRECRRQGRSAVVVVGRPYNTLDAVLSQDVPSYIAECGTTVIPMSCLPFRPELVEGEFNNLFWTNGQKIISSLRQVAGSEGVYAIYLSNFSCGPDSFLLNYAESIMDGKPFLILELDEHGSAGAYQTRIEAFLDVVRADSKGRRSVASGWRPPRESDDAYGLKKRTIWIPPMHPVGNRLFAAAFRRRGYDARVLPQEDDATFSLGKKWTRGAECLPAPLTLGVFLKQMEKERGSGAGLEGRHALFLPTSDGPCRYGQYRTLDRMILDAQGLQDVLILSPGAHNAYYGLEKTLREQLWDAILAGDILFKMGCRVRPYETLKGQADKALEKWTACAESRIESGSIDWPTLLTQATRDFGRLPVSSERRPLVGIVGEIYVRCNGYANRRVVETIEELGGEAWLAPVSEWILYTAWMERYLSGRARSGWRKSLETALKWRYLSAREHRMYGAVESWLGSRIEPDVSEIIEAGRPYLPVDFEGESILTLGRAVLFARQGADVVVNCAPFGCMHGNITSAVFDRISETIGIPVVNTFYDGITGNSLLPTFLHGALKGHESS